MNLPRRVLAPFSYAGLVLCLALAALTARAQRPLGTDVSNYQPANINWTTAKKNGVVFTWVKATEGVGFVNTNFAAQMAGANAAGVYAGAYHFARPSLNPNLTGSASADSEAAYFWGVAGSYVKAGGGYLVPMLDWEDPNATNGYRSLTGMTTSYLSQWVNEWCNDVSNDAATAGVIIRPVVYTGTWYSTAHSGTAQFPGLNSTVTGWPDWFAAYPKSAIAQTGNPGGETPWSSWDIWQYGDTNWTGGDADVYNGSFAGFLQTFAVGGVNAPAFVSAPTNATVALSSNVTFYAKASGSSPTFQWYFNGNPILGAVSSNYTVINVQMTSAGAYTVTANNSYASIPAVATLSVLGPLTNSGSSILDPSSLVNWWTGDGNANDIYGIINASPIGGISYTNGEVGRAFYFDGSYACMSNNAAEIAPPWTVSVWAYRRNAPQASATLLGDQTYALKLEQYNTTREAGISWSGHSDYLFSPAYTMPLNKWTHLAFVATASGVTLFTNGVQEGIVTVSNFQLPRAYIGADWFSTQAGIYTDFLDGGLDDLQIYNRALAPSEIASIYNAGSAGLIRAPLFTGMTNAADGQIQINLIGQTGKPITLRSSPDLINWSTAATVLNNTGATNYTDSTAAGQKFYQATQKY
jgi:GH25 family lysozyme M1 (1,4-beta-N-acetylmuramidase)